MRALTKALVSATTAVGIVAGGLAAAGTAMAAPAPAQQQTTSAEAVAPLAVVNLGLTTTQAKKWQCYLRDWHFNPGTIDGRLGTDSWKAAQRFFNRWGHNGDVTLVVDGDVGPATIRALQRFLDGRVDDLDIDGVAGPKTKDAFAEFTTWVSC